ncbi:Short-chain dehydrogenase [Filimonas lacunae]|uniref:Short-chain dehydrogenase n=1 Tax=Filimonas lacunae TaxID=477680 RepID=A0A173MHP5_9BACT|nr:SDR family oxidoreductase [Filimonas lacunae]BAV07144.1 3-oxoacyl-[acyl-carrier protein] reductase [Filimonas lacunae]SIS94369.1 Short-chain dehydrogenase [Filimonas lacunae]
MSKVWYVTGASKGLGLALVKLLLEKGHKVAATSRKQQELANALPGADAAQFLPLQVDLTNEESIAASLAATHAHFGGLDVVVNNAGYGIGGAIEELSTKEMMDSIQVNLVAMAQVVRYAMPYLRKQRSGNIINISSIAGVAGAMGWAMYAASKAAVIGLTEVLAQDVKELGVKATVICPGGFRTEFLTAESLVIAKNSIEDYTGIHASHQRYLSMNKTQAGDPIKAAEVMMQLVENPAPPVVLYIGTDAYNRAAAKMDEHRVALEENKNISFSTDYTV